MNHYKFKGGFLKEIRMSNIHTIEDMARKIGQPENILRGVENNLIPFPLAYAEIYAQFLDCEPRDFAMALDRRIIVRARKLDILLGKIGDACNDSDIYQMVVEAQKITGEMILKGRVE